MANIKSFLKYFNKKYGKVKTIHRFKYLGEVMQETGLEETVNEALWLKLTTAFRLIKNIYNKKSISKDEKLNQNQNF